MKTPISNTGDKWSTLGLKLRPEDKEIADEFLSNWGALRGISKGDAFMHLIRKSEEYDATTDTIMTRMGDIADTVSALKDGLSELQTVVKLIAFRGDPDAVIRYYNEANGSASHQNSISTREDTDAVDDLSLIAMFSQINTSNDDETSSQTGLHHRGIGTVAGTKRVERNFMKKRHSAN
ncbi:hypothetical protein [Brucella tritici]|uniref:Uncharacterized protein n=1 Tax=Brucella tritici TaxID=94626 RepID=A0A6L3Y337_9HYPH|nr:hypothetical protein [Brucella tritici]KAB2675133.1 hypothetical protein F9L08_27990 [Brucella tritici]